MLERELESLIKLLVYCDFAVSSIYSRRAPLGYKTFSHSSPSGGKSTIYKRKNIIAFSVHSPHRLGLSKNCKSSIVFFSIVVYGEFHMWSEKEKNLLDSNVINVCVCVLHNMFHTFSFPTHTNVFASYMKKAREFFKEFSHLFAVRFRMIKAHRSFAFVCS